MSGTDEGECERCFELVDDINIEAFEITGQVLCESCCADLFEELSDELL